MIKKIPLLILSFIFMKDSQAQCMLRELSLNEKAQASVLIVEARVKDKFSFWNDMHTRIFTSNKLEIYKIFKGQVNQAEVELITEGGIVGSDKHTVQPGLELEIGNAGIFFMLNGETPNQFIPYGGVHGLIEYDKEIETASDPFKQYKNIPELYKDLTILTGPCKEYKQLKAPEDQKPNLKATVAINNFNPSTVSAGTGTQLTINGSGFGNAQGATAYVEFQDADAGGGNNYMQPLASEYVSWSDNQIIIRVPKRAGTGTFRVRNGASTASSSSALTVTYSHLNVPYNGNVFQVSFIDKHLNGGYIWQMNTDFANNTAAKEAFNRAFENWRCKTYVKWEVGSTTTTNVTGFDGIDVIRFDTGAELPAGILGTCYSYYNVCGSGSNMTWYVNEQDLVFDHATNWNFGPAAPSSNERDFESIALHELGHAHMLGHVINTSEVMYYGLGAGQSRRILNSNDMEGGNYILNRSIASGACSNGPMIPFNSSNCSGAYTTVAENNNSLPVNIYPNPSEGIFTIWMNEMDRHDIEITVNNLLGQQIYTNRLSMEDRKEVNLSGYSKGVYFLRMESGDKIVVQKLYLTK